MSGRKVHVVVGSAGEYSDWRMWLVCAYDTAEETKHEADRLTAWVEQHTEPQGRWDRRWIGDEKPKVPGDENGEYSEWEIPRYEVHEVPAGVVREWQS